MSENDPSAQRGSLVVCALLRDASDWLDYLAHGLAEISRFFEPVKLVFVESNSRDATVKKAFRLVDVYGGELIKFGNDSERDALHRTARLAQFRRRARSASLELNSDWILFIDSDIYFSSQTIQALCRSVDRQSGRGLFTAFTLGVRVLARTSDWILVKSRSMREHHYFDTFALHLNNGVIHFPECPFSGCAKCRINYIDPHEYTDLSVQSAFGGLALIHGELLRGTGADWPDSVLQGECEHIGFCRALSGAGVPTFVVTDAVAFCNR